MEGVAGEEDEDEVAEEEGDLYKSSWVEMYPEMFIWTKKILRMCLFLISS